AGATGVGSRSGDRLRAEFEVSARDSRCAETGEWHAAWSPTRTGSDGGIARTSFSCVGQRQHGQSKESHANSVLRSSVDGAAAASADNRTAGGALAQLRSGTSRLGYRGAANCRSG